MAHYVQAHGSAMPMNAAERSLAVARVLDAALAEAARLGWEDAERRLRQGERDAVALGGTPGERVEIGRRIAERLLLLACSRNEAWSLIRASFDAVEALGFTDADRHVQMAALMARWCIDNHAHHEDALRKLRRARAHVARLRKNEELRKRLLAQVAEFEKLLGNG